MKKDMKNGRIVVIRGYKKKVVTVNERMKDLRTETKLKQGEFGSLFGLSKSTISDYEQDGNTLPIIAKTKLMLLWTKYSLFSLF